MPKIRCQSCEAVLNVPEKAMGKTVSCPKCREKIKVPGARQPGSASQKSPSKKRPAKATATDDLLGLGDLDDYAMEDQDSQICPYCAADIDEDDVICARCGVNLETGQMDRREAKKRARKGPDPAKFYREAWAESWNFMLSEPRMALRVGTGLSFFSVLALMCGYMGFVYVQEQMPPKVFWICMCLLCGFSVPGLLWYLSLKVIEATRLKTQFQSDRIQFDLFTSIASGVRIVAWPLILIPGTPALIGLYFTIFEQNPADPILVGTIAGIFGIAYFLLPLALIHMTARYTYKGWILWELVSILFQNLTALLYIHLVAIVAMLPVLLVAAPILLVIKGSGGIGDLNPFGSAVVNGAITNIALWFFGLIDMRIDPEGVMFTLMRVPMNIAASFLIVAPIGYLAAFPAIFAMKATGLFGYYNAETLSLVDKKPEYQLATFWVRYLSHYIDSTCSILAVFLVSSNPKLSKLAWTLTAFVILAGIFAPVALPGLFVVWLFYTNWMYWCVQEASELRSTIGKDAFGLIVITEDNKQLTLKQASMKWLLRIVSDLLVGLPYLGAAFPPKRQTLHDMSTKTKVVWKGDR